MVAPMALFPILKTPWVLQFSTNIGMKVLHPRYGVGVIKALTERHRGYCF